MHKVLIVWSMTALVIGGSTACATKKFVGTSVGDVNEKVESLGKSVEQTQERTRQNESRIGQGRSLWVVRKGEPARHLSFTELGTRCDVTLWISDAARLRGGRYHLAGRGWTSMLAIMPLSLCSEM